MASLRDLHLPPLTAEETSLGWDETIGNTSSRPWERPSLSSHAMAHGTYVCGLSNDENDNWMTWKTSFAPQQVCRVACNQDGSIIVASTDGGTVSLLRARDGKVLATRRVSTNTTRPAEVVFCSNSHRFHAKDVLVILIPSATLSVDHNYADDAPNHVNSVILVSNICGVRLNGENVESVADAAKSMSIDALRLQTQCGDLESLQGCFLHPTTIRFAAGEQNGNVSIHDYDLQTKQSVVIQPNVSDQWTFFTTLGMRLQHYGEEQQQQQQQHTFLLACGRDDDTALTKLVWYNLAHLNMACSSTLSTKPLAFEPVTSYCNESALAVAVAMQDSASGFIQVLQVVAQETMGLAVLSGPHEVYRIPIIQQQQHAQSSLQGIDLQALDPPYSFRFRTRFGSDHVACGEFVTREDNVIGKIRCLIQREEYHEVESIILAANDDPIEDSFASFHSSELALRRLERLLSAGSLASSDLHMERARDCLRRLVVGAASSSGQKHLVEAAEVVLLWPTHNNNTKPSVAQFSVALTAMISAMNAALETQTAHLLPMETKKQELEDRLSAMHCISALVQTSDVPLGPPFLATKSPSDVFCVLTEGGLFSVAEKFWRSEWGRHLSPETLAACILGLTPTQDPRAYATLLLEAVMPQLSITHEAIPLIRAWACRCADAFDEDESNDELDLGASIFLLKTVLSGMQQLNFRVHSSFASYSPFTERRDFRKPRQSSPRNIALDTPVSSFSPEGSAPLEQRRDSTSSLPVNQHPTPTVLELGFLKTGAMKSALCSFPKRKSGVAASLLDDGIDDCEENVEIKLQHARRLEEARKLGLPRSVVTLRQYLRLGGTERVAKELVRIHSSGSFSHEERQLALTLKVKPFCDQAGVDYDQILKEYNSDLCDSKCTSAKALVESSSVARCCVDPLVRCEVALAVLRVALLSGKAPSSLTQLSHDAIEWAAVNATVKSEIQEATRLLVVDGIVRKYCGPGAGELFRVDNPLHAIRLVDFVSRHFRTTSVLSDMLDLCDAFTFLTREEACILVLERAAAAGDAELCVKLLGHVFALGDAISENVGRRAIQYCSHALEEACSSLSHSEDGLHPVTCREKAISSCRVARTIAEACHAHFYQGCDNSSFLRPSFGALLRDFERIQRLQERHNLFLPLSVFDTPGATLRASRSVLNPVVEAFVNGKLEDGEILLLRAKAACTVLSGPNSHGDQSLWYTMAGEAASRIASSTDDGRYIDFLASAGILNDFGDEDAVHTLLYVALTLCRRASKESFGGAGFDTLRRMEDVIRASSLIHDYALIDCPERIFVSLVSIGLLTETASQVLLRADEGLGEALETLSEKLACDARMRRNHVKTRDGPINGKYVNVLRIGRPLLHPSWYVGDGLLLPPRDALHTSVAYCIDVLDVCLKSGNPPASADGPVALHRFLGERGAHAVALRIVCVYTSMALSAGRLPSSFDGKTIGDYFLQNQRNTLICLAERSLGGSGSGITSVTIDSQLAVTFLLSLPLKVAFKVYQAPLPTAITKRDFSRVITLSNIGVAAGDGETGWKKQSVFVTQCLRLTSRARWWKILKRYQVDFDPSRFEDDDSLHDDAGSKGTSAYVSSLIPELISKASLVHKSTALVRNIATRFVSAFGLDPILAAQKHVEYVLSYPPVDCSDSDKSCVSDRTHGPGSDIRWNLSLCERTARESLRLISSPMKRSAVLRRCVTSLENTVSCEKDYERHAMVLSFYHADLSLVVAKDPTIRDLDASAFEEELELIERRRDALAILSSFFQGEQRVHRPSFPKFFAPLPVPFTAEQRNTDIGTHDILGVVADASLGTFDPLSPLQDFLSSHMDDADAKAIAPLTIPLGLPHGSIHARCLIERFRRFRDGKGTLPSFEHDVLPVLNRLKQSNDQCRLAEWCVAYYDDNDSQKLQCLDHGLRYAMAASSELEKRIFYKSKGDEERLRTDERNALDSVKRLSEMHSALSDRLEVNRILRSAKIGSSQQFRFVEIMVRDLTNRLQESFWASADSSPEKFVEVLLVEASLLASNACFDLDISFSVSQFRHMASVVHQACKRIADQYSHVHPGDISRCLARRWLVHGDELSSSGRTESGKQPLNDSSRHLNGELSSSVSADEGDTVDFVMDLNSLGEAKAVWSDDIGSGPLHKGDKSATISMEEEPSALKPDGSSREASEIGSTKVALRVAFVMSFAEGYHRSGIIESNDDENMSSKANTNGMPNSGLPKKSRPGLLSRVSAKDSNARTSVIEHARELLAIVFAKSGGSDVDPSMSFISTSTSADEKSDARKTLTFAMRYRALRSAAIMCPQVALDQVVTEEGYFATGVADTECSLQKCTYGAFVAKEIEEMGLPLPHSDLVQLSTMHFPSYARALWRHHRDGDIRGKKGRLLLLLLEMSLKDSSDSELTVALLNEMSKLRLPRTLMLGCECVAKFKLRAGVAKSSSLLRDESQAVSDAVFTAANLVLTEVHRSLLSASSQDLDKGLPTVRRVGNLVQMFSDTEAGQRQLSQFVKVLVDLVAVGNDSSSFTLADIALNASHCLSSVQSRQQFFVLLAQRPSGEAAIRHRGKAIASLHKENRSALNALLFEIETSYDPVADIVLKDDSVDGTNDAA